MMPLSVAVRAEHNTLGYFCKDCLSGKSALSGAPANDEGFCSRINVVEVKTGMVIFRALTAPEATLQIMVPSLESLAKVGFPLGTLARPTQYSRLILGIVAARCSSDSSELLHRHLTSLLSYSRHEAEGNTDGR